MKSLADRLVPSVRYLNGDGEAMFVRDFEEYQNQLRANIAELERGATLVHGVRGADSRCWYINKSGGDTHIALLIDVQPTADQELRDRGYSEESIASVKRGLEQAKLNNVYSDDRCKQAAERLRNLANGRPEDHGYAESLRLNLVEIADSLDPVPSKQEPVTTAEIVQALLASDLPYAEELMARIERDGIEAPRRANEESLRDIIANMPPKLESDLMLVQAFLNNISKFAIDCNHSGIKHQAAQAFNATERMLADISKNQPKNDTSAGRIEICNTCNEVMAEVERETRHIPQPGSDLAVPWLKVERALLDAAASYHYRGKRPENIRELLDQLFEVKSGMGAARAAGHPTGVK